MAINWDALEKKAREKDAKALKKNPSGYIGQKSGAANKQTQKEQKAKEKKLAGLKKDKTVTNRNGKKVNAGGRKKLTPEAQKYQSESFKNALESFKKTAQGSSYVAPDGSKPKTIQGTAIYQKGSKTEAREKLRKSGKKIVQKSDDKVFENIAKEKGAAGTFGRAYTGVGSGFVDSFTAFPSAVASKITGKNIDIQEKLGLNMPEKNPLEDTTAYQYGKLGGELLGYAVQNKAFEPIVNAALKGTKLGKMAEETFKQRAIKSAARNAIEAGSIGLAQNIGIAQQEGLKGKDFAKDVLTNTGLDLVAGSAIDIVPDAFKTTKNALKNTKLAKQSAKQAENLNVLKQGDELLDTAKKIDVNANERLGEGTTQNIITDTKKEINTAKDNLKKVRESANLDGLDNDVVDMLKKGQMTPDEIRKSDLPNKDNILKVYDAEKAYEVEKELPKNNKINGFDVETPKSKVGIVNPDVQFVGDKIENAKGLFDKFYKNTVSGQKELERMSKVAGNTKVDDYTQAVRTAKGTVSNIFNESLVDTAGKVINKKSYKSLISEIPKDVRKDFQTYAEHLHNIDRVREGVPVYKQFTAEQSQQIVDDMLKKHPEFKQYTKDINEWWNQFTKAWLLDTGRISKESYEAMLKKYPNYIPTYRVEKGFGGTGSLPNRVNVGSGVKGAKGGESEIIPLEDSFLAQIDRIVSGTRKNDLYASVIEEISKNPEKMKSFGVLTENKDILNNDILDNMLSDATVKAKGKDMYEAIVNEMSEIDRRGLQEVKNGVGMVTAYIDGKPVSAYINKDMLDALNLLNDSYDSEVVREISKIGRSITNPVKAGITGYNPLFIISNVSRDLPTLYIQSQHSMWKTTTGLGKAIKAMMTNDEIYKTYKALGGKQSGYYAAGKGFDDALTQKGVKKLWSNVESLMSILGEGTETIPRLAEFINSAEKYGYTKDGLLRAAKDAAESTVNFKRTAPVTKAVDSWVLYLNAAVQGLDKFGRTIKNAPLKTLGRSAAMISVPYVLLTAKNWDNPHYQDLNERTKQNYFCIPNIAGEKDEQGYAKTFIKVPVNREYGAIAAASFDIIFDMLDGKSFEEATKGYKETIKNNFVPPSLEENIFAPITKHLPENKDFAGRSIAPESLVNASPKYQQDYTTSGVAKGVANVANFLGDKGLPMPDTLKSPKKVDYLIDSYGGYLGQVAQGATGNNTTDLKSGVEGAFIDPFKQRFTADARFSSGPIADFYDAKDKALIEKNDAKLEGKETSEGQIKSKVYNKISKQMSELTKEEKDIQSSNLPKKEKDRKVKELRTKKNELAKGADAEVKKAVAEYKSAPTFANLPTKTKEKYNSNTGLSKEKWAKAYESQKDEDRHFAKAVLMVENGVTSYNQAKTIYSGLSQNSYNEGVALYNAGVKIDDVKRAYANANTDGGGLSKAETMAYLNGTNYSREQKRAIFDALMGNAKNPY